MKVCMPNALNKDLVKPFTLKQITKRKKSSNSLCRTGHVLFSVQHFSSYSGPLFVIQKGRAWKYSYSLLYVGEFVLVLCCCLTVQTIDSVESIP